MAGDVGADAEAEAASAIGEDEASTSATSASAPVAKATPVVGTAAAVSKGDDALPPLEGSSEDAGGAAAPAAGRGVDAMETEVRRLG